jgi:iron complex transport system substrate-binding protein
MKRSVLTCTLAFTALLGAFAAGPSVTDSLGRKVSLDKPALRVVSLSPSATEILFALGAADAVMGVTDYCNFPPEAVAKPKVGGFSGKTISIEQIVSMRPDLVIVAGGMHEKVMGMLSTVGITSFAAEPTTITEIYANIRAIGLLIGKDANAEKVVLAMKTKIETVGAKVSSGKKPKVFWELWDDPLMSAGGPTFINEAIRLAGGTNVFADMKEQWPMVSLEEILIRNPEWIVSGDDHGDRMNAEQLKKRNGWTNVAAVKNNRIALVEADEINRSGPRFANAVEALARVFHPDLMKP